MGKTNERLDVSKLVISETADEAAYRGIKEATSIAKLGRWHLGKESHTAFNRYTEYVNDVDRRTDTDGYIRKLRLHESHEDDDYECEMPEGLRIDGEDVYFHGRFVGYLNRWGEAIFTALSSCPEEVKEYFLCRDFIVRNHSFESVSRSGRLHESNWERACADYYNAHHDDSFYDLDDDSKAEYYNRWMDGNLEESCKRVKESITGPGGWDDVPEETKEDFSCLCALLGDPAAMYNVLKRLHLSKDELEDIIDAIPTDGKCVGSPEGGCPDCSGVPESIDMFDKVDSRHRKKIDDIFRKCGQEEALHMLLLYAPRDAIYFNRVVSTMVFLYLLSPIKDSRQPRSAAKINEAYEEEEDYDEDKYLDRMDYDLSMYSLKTTEYTKEYSIYEVVGPGGGKKVWWYVVADFGDDVLHLFYFSKLEDAISYWDNPVPDWKEEFASASFMKEDIEVRHRIESVEGLTDDKNGFVLECSEGDEKFPVEVRVCTEAYYRGGYGGPEVTFPEGEPGKSRKG